MRHTGSHQGSEGGGGQCRIGLPLPLPKFKGGRVSQHNDGDPPGAVGDKIERLNRYYHAKYAQEHPSEGTDLGRPRPKQRPVQATTVKPKYGVGGSQHQRTQTGGAFEEVK